MRQEIIKELELITDEEKRVLSGEKQQVVWDIYSSKDKFEVDAKRLIRQGELLQCYVLLLYSKTGYLLLP